MNINNLIREYICLVDELDKIISENKKVAGISNNITLNGNYFPKDLMKIIDSREFTIVGEEKESNRDSFVLEYYNNEQINFGNQFYFFQSKQNSNWIH